MLTLINNRYRVIQELGKGGMGAVYLVEDTLKDNQVMTLKMIRADLLGPAGRNLTQFKYEFAALGQLSHPNLVAVYDFGVTADSQEYFYTMEYAPGQDLPSLAAQRTAGAPSDYTWLYEITVQICRALQYTHSRGLVHYDVKPQNVRITPQGRVKLMDFGLIGEARGPGGQIQIRGTPEYIAPELIRGDPVDHRADLYSLGVALYEVVTGRLPFSDTSSIIVLRQHIEETPEPPRDLVKDLPPALQTLILKLMAKEPVNRYGSANQVIEAINKLAGLDFPVETEETKRSYVQSGRFVGREYELARLQGLLMRAIQGQGRLVLITGGIGVGKSRLARELRRQAQMQRVLVCEAVCRQHARIPYGPWVSIFSQMVAYARRRPGDNQWLGAYRAPLVKLMPELAAYFPAGATDAPLTQDDKQSLMDATARFLHAYDQPLLFILEDLRHADTETIELLDYLGQRAPQGRWLLCGIYREHDIDETSPLDDLARQAHDISHQDEPAESDEKPFDLLHLECLSADASAELVKSMLGVQELPAGLFPRLMAETGGDPLLIESLMRNLVEDDQLWYDGQKWRIDLADLHIPISIQEAAQRRLERLDPASLNMLQWAAAMGGWLDLDILVQVCNLAPDRAFSLIAEAVQWHVLAVSGQARETTYHFNTEQMREAVYNTLSLEQRVERHQRIGQVLQELYDENVIAALLAWHFERAGDIGLALRYAKMAADKTRKTFANESAIQHYSQALELARRPDSPADSQIEYDLLAGREACYRLTGNRQAQRVDLEEMAHIAREIRDVARQIEVATRRVTLAQALGNHADARQAAKAALNLARQAGDRKLKADSLTSLGKACYTLGDYKDAQACQEQALTLYQELGDRPGEATSLRQLSRTAFQTGKLAQAQDLLTQALVIYRALDDRRGEADALNGLGVQASDYAQKRHYHEQSLVIRQAIGNRSGQAQSYNNLGLIYWYLGLYGRARDYLEQATQIVRDLGGRSKLSFYLESLGRVYLELQDYAQAQQILEEGRALAIDSGNRWVESAYWTMLGRVELARGRPDTARELIQVACDMQRELGTPDLLSTSLAWLGATCLALGDWEIAHRCTSEAIRHREAAGDSGDYPSQDVWWLHYQTLKATPGRAADDPLDDEAWTCLQRARDTMMAGVANLSDQSLRRNYLNKVKTNQDIVTEWARQSGARSDRATGEEPPLLLAELAGPEKELETQAADQIGDRLKRVLDISARMNETHEAENLLDYVMDQVIELSGAERGFLVLVDEAGRMDFKVALGMAEEEIERARAQISYTVLGAVAQTQAPILLQDALTDERFGRQSSVLELNLRSVLCVPLVSGAELVGMIYADNRSVSGRFSQADVDLMSILANQAAIAIENARLYQETIRANKELEAWAHTLEQRVAERTAELQQAYDQITQFNEQLEQMVQQRTEELRQTYQTLERLDKTKSDFIDVTAHELRTPLTIIKGYTQVLEIDPLVKGNQRIGELLEGILVGANRLHEIVNNMLDVTKIDSDALSLCKGPARMLDVIQGLEAKFESVLQERRLTLTMTDLGDLPFISAEANLLFKVFDHLIVNAIKYTPDGGSITVTGKTVYNQEGKPMVEIVVSDTGIGIDPEHHELIFEKFYQTGEVALHSSGRTKFKGGGPGLGLSIVQGIVEAYGGQVWVESPGYDEETLPGSHFHIRLPISKAGLESARTIP